MNLKRFTPPPEEKRGLSGVKKKNKKKYNRKVAFTLAETLIALAIIGIISILMINFIFGKVMDNVRAKHTIASKHKFAKSIENMALNYGIGPYYGTGEEKYDATSEFVQKLSQYYKINRICDTNSLDDCWGYKIINLNGKLFKNGGNENLADDYDNETRGILGTDGTRFILSYNKNCNELDPQIFTWNSNGTNNNAMNCIAAIIDIDGNKAPNRVGKDISFINATGIGDNCIIKIGDACFGAMFQPDGVMSLEECMEHKDEWGLTYCMGETNDEIELDFYNYGGDYYAGAAKTCGGKANLIAKDEVKELFLNMYEEYEAELSSAVDVRGVDVTECCFSKYIEGSAGDLGLVDPTTPLNPFYGFADTDYYLTVSGPESIDRFGSVNRPYAFYTSEFAGFGIDDDKAVFFTSSNIYTLCRMN